MMNVYLFGSNGGGMLLTVTCAVVLEQNDHLLLVQESAAEIYGKWNQPSGHWEPGETLLHCAVREAREESGYPVELTGLQAIYTTADAHRQRVNFCFRARPCGDPGPIDPAEILAIRWFSKDELRQLPDAQLRHPLAKLRIEDWLAGKSAPMQVIRPWGL
jgi:8-oxo-dGTP pyrophosphatase MutT (NUDIX family)